MTRESKVLRFFIFHLSLLISASCALAQDALVVYPDYPSAIERDGFYRVEVTQGKTTRPLVVWNHCEKDALRDRTYGGDVNRRFCEFAFEGRPVRVDIAVNGDVDSYNVFPTAKRLRHSFKDGVISVWLDKPEYFGVRINDYDKTILSVFADAPETDVPPKDKSGCLYVEGWMDAPGRDGILPLADDIREIYIAPGAVLNARLKLKAKGMRLHGRGMILDPMSDIFRYDQTQNTSRGLVAVGGAGTLVEDVKLIDARTFNITCWADNAVFRNVKMLASMMCSDGFTNGRKNLLVEHSWVYVGDNALVVSGVEDALYRDVTIGTTCKAVFPQSTNRRVTMEDINVFRADEGLVGNEYNGVLRRNNKWNEMNGGAQKREPGPQDLKHQAEDFVFRRFSAVADVVRVGWKFRGRSAAEWSADANLVAENLPRHSIWSRFPSWMTKLEATERDEAGAPVYHLVQCEKNAGMQCVVSEGFKAQGNGRWVFSGEAKLSGDSKTQFELHLFSNETRYVSKPLEIPCDDSWHKIEFAFDTDFDLAHTELVALNLRSLTAAEHIRFRDLSFVHR